jgi:hypothetical protein
VEMGQADLLPTTSCQVGTNKSPKNLCLSKETRDSLDVALPFARETTERYGIEHEFATVATRDNCYRSYT